MHFNALFKGRIFNPKNRSDLDHGVLKSARVEEALRRVDRKHYCRSRAFEDSPQPIGMND